MANRDPKVVSFTMSHIKGKDTGIEMILRKALSERGIKYRLYSGNVFGHPDIVISKYKIAIFADSEFWHGYNFEENKKNLHTHLDYWIPKIERNIERDKEVNAELERQGYSVLRFWGFEINKNLDAVMKTILKAYDEKKRAYELSASIDKKDYTTLCYIEKGDSYLLLHRVKKKDDLNEGKWIGVGGHVEEGESPSSCMKREIKEETGLDVISYQYLGKVDFLNDRYPPERMYLYKVTGFTGELRDCDEGELSWIKKERMMSLPMWEGDKYFLPLLEKEEASAFSLALIYEDDVLTKVYGPCFPARKNRGKAKKKRKTKNNGEKPGKENRRHRPE